MKKWLLMCLLLSGCVSNQQLQNQAALDAVNTCAPLRGKPEHDTCLVNTGQQYYAMYVNQEMVRRQAMANAMQQQSAYHQQQALIAQQNMGYAMQNAYKPRQLTNTQCQMNGQFMNCRTY